MHEFYESGAGGGTESVREEDDLVRGEWLGSRRGTIAIAVDDNARRGVGVIGGVFGKDAAGEVVALDRGEKIAMIGMRAEEFWPRGEIGTSGSVQINGCNPHICRQCLVKRLVQLLGGVIGRKGVAKRVPESVCAKPCCVECID